MPRLRGEIVRLAADMANDETTFSAALAEIMAEAHRLGAGYLADDDHEEFRDWASTTLLDQALLAEEAATLVARLIREPSRAVMRAAILEFIDGD